ncbi:MAG TPA: hypothetical protein DET40_22610 [Lentisphaeria bacterium]|nr:MAG: hypothetical protein A2X45_17340 [Lentisphaerae bacterium GWF2_50_93]HCE46348.1 hypothetical protein [Lentisphaeria bacterium]
MKNSLTCFLLTILAFQLCSQEKKMNEEYLEFNYGQDTGGEEWIQSIRVKKPELRSAIKGDVVVEFTASGMKFAKAMCWQQPLPTVREEPGFFTKLFNTVFFVDEKKPEDVAGKWGHDVNLTPGGIELGPDGHGSFVFPAEQFPHGPTNIRIFTNDGKGKRDVFELQLYNTGGQKWNAGIPKEDPPAAKGMQLVFSDDFDGPLSISKDGRGTRYNAHKPKFGDFSGWPFSDPSGLENPFEQIDTYLRIKARKPAGTKGSTGLIATVDMDGKGFWAMPPCYLECRFTAQSAPGTWPAFWTITALDKGKPGDELDIIEAYGGVGKKNPNHSGYSIVTHFWRQTETDGSKKKGFSAKPNIMELGGKSYWSATFHTYGVLVTQKDTVYYFDNIEVLRHPTNEMSLNPHCILANYAIGGISGWQIDLDRYGNGSDMYIDYIRVYRASAQAKEQ